MGKFDKYEKRFYEAFSGVSFSPEKRAKSCVQEFNEELEEDLKELEKNVGCVNYEEKYIDKVLIWAYRKSRCLSFLITGPANFPVARNAKANRSADKAWTDFRDWRKRYIKRVTATPTPSPEEDLDKALKELDKQSEAHEMMKIINKCFRKFDLSIEQRLKLIQEETGCTDEVLEKLSKPDHMGGYGFASYALTNSNARIKNLKDKVLTMKARIKVKSKWEPILFNGGKIDIQADRVVVFHDEKPAAEVISALKSRGFRWSRQYSCWCRKHTAQAIIDAKQICIIKEAV